MKKITFSLITVAFSAVTLVAQSVEQGKKFFYYQRYKSAKEQFEKTIAANPNNLDAIYWQGQTLLEEKNQAGAKDLYQKTLMANGTAPIVLVGMGHIELLEGKTNDAKQRFETALSLSKNKDLGILNAIGRASTDAKEGDANYAIEKLTAATQAKDFKNAETWMTIGDAYRKLIDGGNAITAYNKALAIDPKLAAAPYKIGKVYLTQGNSQKELFLKYFNDAVTLDPNYAPGLYELYYYWYFHEDVAKATGYFEKYLAVTDPKPTDDYDRIALQWVGKKYNECISAAQQKLSTLGANADPRYYKLIAYCYDDLKDSVNAKASLEQYFAKQKPDGFIARDYEFKAQLLSKFPGNEVEALNSYEQAIQADTIYETRVDLMGKAAAFAKKSGNRVQEAKWQEIIYKTKRNPSKTDLYNWGFANYQAANYPKSDSIWNVYMEKYPDEIFGYLWKANTALATDTTMASGILVAPFEKLAEMSKKIDSVKYKGQAVRSYFLLAQYSNDIKKDKSAAISYLKKVLEVDPANPNAPSLIKQLESAASRPPATTKPPTPPAKPKTGGGTKPSGTKAAAIKKNNNSYLV
jgi:tetratricopeptide (TPR) repeat protein